MPFVQTTLEGARLEVDKTLVNLDKLKGELASVEEVALRYLALANRMNLPEDLNAAITVAQRAAVNMAQLERSMVLFHAALVGAGPLGWLAFAAAAGITALSFVDTIEVARRTR